MRLTGGEDVSGIVTGGVNMRELLTKHGIAEPILAQWEKRFGGRLLPLQYRAVEEYGLLAGRSLLISAPTSSGKTFCGEMALIRAAMDRKKGIFLAPLKAVAEEKFRRFSECYSGIGLKTIIATRDHPENDGDIVNGRFDIAVMVYEKFNAALLANFDLMSQVGAVVVDELQMLADPSRGAQLELALTKLLYSKYDPQIIALSAVVGEATGLAEWLDCRLLLEKSRPVELKRGVAVDGRFHFRCHNSGERGEEEFADGGDPSETLFRHLQRMFERERQALVFLKSRRDTVTAAERFVEYAGLETLPDNAAFVDQRLSGEEDSSLLRNLESLLQYGVAFHNADLTMGQRQAVEDGYHRGLIRIIFATTTLATGINLPAATVFIEAQKYSQQGYTNRPTMEPLSWSEYESMSGRAGRTGLLGAKETSGRAVLIASGELDKTILWDYYIDKHPDPLPSQLTARRAEDIVLDLFCSGLADSPEGIAAIIGRTYYDACNELSININDNLYEELLEGGFLERTGFRLSPTPLGRAAATTGLTAAGTKYLLDMHRAHASDNDSRLLYHLFQSPEGRAIYLPGPGCAGIRGGGDGSYNDENHPLTEYLAGLRRELTPEERSRVRLVRLMEDWMGGIAALDIENDYRLHPGIMEKLAGQAGWLIASSASVIRAHDRLSHVPARLDKLAFSARTGLPPELEKIHRLLGDNLHRSEWLSLHHDGIHDTKRLFEEGMAVLRRLISSEERLRSIEQRIQNIKEDIMQATSTYVSDSSIHPESIEIDGTPVRERFLVRINGRPIKLTGKSFKYLVRLVWSRLRNDHGWLYKEDLEKGFNQARYLYRLRQEIGRDFLPEWPLYENNRSGYYRLAAERERLRVNVDALRDFPDYEVREMARDLTAPSTA